MHCSWVCAHFFLYIQDDILPYYAAYKCFAELLQSSDLKVRDTIIIIIKIYIVCLSVCPFVTGVHRKSLDPEPEAAASLGHRRSEAMERVPMGTLAKVLATGKTTLQQTTRKSTSFPQAD